MMNKNIVISLLVAGMIAIAGYEVYKNLHKERNGFIVSQQVFEKFKGKEYLEKEVVSLKTTNKRILDSLDQLIQNSNNDASLIQTYQRTARTFDLKEQELSDKYTAEIWKNINTYVSEFGREKRYTFIFGATGDGSLMYADTLNNITEPVIKYLNAKYEGRN